MADAIGAQRAWYLGLTAVVLLMVGTGWYQVFDVAPYYHADEQAHVGYVQELLHGRLPTIDTHIDDRESSGVLHERLKLTPDRNDDIWVANNPPVAYVTFVPAAAVGRVLDLPTGPLVPMRITNLLFFGASVVVVARLGRRLAGDDPTVGILAAALVATVPYVGAMSGAAYVDGIALLCTVAMLDALVALTLAGPTRRQVVALSVWCALGAGVRPMTAAFAGAVGAMAMAVVLLRTIQQRRAAAPEDPEDAAPTRAGLLWSGAVMAVPTLVLDGWYYLRNRRLYGDPTASEHLFTKFDRTARDLPLTDVWRHEVWAPPVETLVNRRMPLAVARTPTTLWQVTWWALIAFALVATAIVVVDQVAARRRGEPPRTPALGWLAAAALVVVVVGLTLQHWQGGGNIHPRYLLFGVVIVAVAVAFPLVRLRARWAGAALVGALVALQAEEIPDMNRTIREQPWMTRAPRVLVNAIGPPSVRFLGIVIMAVGLVALVVALVGLSRRTADAAPAAPGEPT